MSDMLRSYIDGSWRTPGGTGTLLADATTGDEVARWSTEPVDAAAALEHARRVGAPALRELTFHQRAAALKSLAKHLSAHTDEFSELSTSTGATRRDSAVDVDGGIGVLFVYAAKGTRELPDAHYHVDGDEEQLGKGGTFVAQHGRTPLRGAAVQINAYNFPVWGMLEKLAPAFLAGVPSLVKPAARTAYLTELVFRRIIESGLVPEGSVQLLAGGVGDLLDRLNEQDTVAFTGSAPTAQRLRTHENLVRGSVRFNAEADSLNYAVLGPEATPGSPEFDLFVTQLVTEMTVKAGQKCTAIRRALVPSALLADVTAAVREELSTVTVGDPRQESVRMGPLVSLGQREEVLRSLKGLCEAGTPIFGDPERFEVTGADAERGAFLPPVLLRCEDPDRREPHEIEAFGPVSTLLPYDGTAERAAAYAARGAGSLVGSVVSNDEDFVREMVLATAPWHGRLHILDRDDAEESTGHGSPMPQLVHGRPGRAGGGEELGGVRSVLHYTQRTAIQGSPAKVRLFSGGS